MSAASRFRPAHMHAVSRNLLTAAGAPRHVADTVSEILVNSNLSGHDSHGVLRIPTYLDGIAGGSIVPAAEPEIVRKRYEYADCRRTQRDGHLHRAKSHRPRHR